MNIRRYLLPVGLLLVLLVPLALAPIDALALSRTVNQKVIKSVVQILAARQDRRGNLTPLWSGSGTIVSTDGLILTNCHVANPQAMWGSDYRYDVLIVAITTKSDDPPTPTFTAEVVQYDPALDLAVIRLNGYFNGNKFDASKLNLPALTLGDSDEIEIGDDISIFGYPGIGGETITLTSGKVSGFSRESGITGRAWIKTDATIAGGNSGGTAVDENGALIGIPTQGGSGGEGEIVDCRPVTDTNGDGVLDEKDTCVPIGGFINALRPVNLAKPLIQAASRGINTPPPTEPDKPTQPTGQATISRPFFAPAVNDYDQPTTVVYSFPSGTNEMYLFFDYANFQDGLPWQPVLSIDGEVIEDIWPVAGWNGGLQGSWWISVYNEPLPDGDYEFALYYDGQELATAAVTVGGKAAKVASFSDIVLSGDGQEGFLLPAGTKTIEATFSYANFTKSNKWSYIWYLEGKKLNSGSGTALTTASGQTRASLTAAKGFDPGNYRLELYIDNKLAATSDFIVGGEKTGVGVGSSLFGPIVFAEDVDKKDQPVRPATQFDSGQPAIYAFFDYQGMQDGWEWTRRWYIDDELVLDTSASWEGGEAGNWWVSVYNEDGLPDGKYTLELLVKGQTARSGDCFVGKGGGPIAPPVAEGDVEIYGRIVDADTNKGIQGAVFIVLVPGVTIDSFQWVEDEVFAVAETDRNGNYTLSAPLVRGETYSMIVGAEGYSMIAEDGVAIPEDIESPFELNLALQRQ